MSITLSWREALLLEPPTLDTPFHLRRSAYVVSGALATVTAAAAASTWFLPDVLHGPDAMNGSARGTALVVLCVTLPTLLLAMWRTHAGSLRAPFVWFGALAHVLYQAFLFVLATPFNELYLLYVAMLGLGAWALGTGIAQTDARRLPAVVDGDVPARPVAVFTWVVVALNALAWLAADVPALFEADAPTMLDGTGLTTNPIHVQDLALWLPVLAVGARWLWRREGRGLLVVGAGMVMWAIESLTVAVDQWVGHHADPASPVVSTDLVPAFVVVGLVTGLVAVALLRHVRPEV